MTMVGHMMLLGSVFFLQYACPCMLICVNFAMDNIWIPAPHYTFKSVATTVYVHCDLVKHPGF